MAMFSHSRLSTFENCRLKFKYKYLDKLKTDVTQGVEAFMGSMVHKALEKLYRDLRHQRHDTLKELLAWYNAQWKKNWNQGIIIVRKDYTQENYRKMGEKFITDYYNKYKPFDQDRTIGLEKRVVIRLDKEGRYKLQGYMDRLAYTGDGFYEIHDYKTKAELPINEYLEDDRQLALYALAVLKDYQDAERVRLVWHFLAHDKEFVMEKSTEELETLRKETIKLIDEIESEKDFHPTPSKLCDWCEFRVECPMTKHQAIANNLPPNQYLKEPGVNLVNRFVELRNRRSELDEEIEKVKEAILAYSRKQGLIMISGSDSSVRVWRKDVWKFPGKAEDSREELDAFIRKSGLWNDFSMLDTWKLEKILEEKNWPADLKEGIKKFARKELVERLYVNKPTTGD
jgi:putative RecB family exonuclease